MRRKQHVVMYQSPRHLFLTIFFVALPFALLLLFARAANIALGRLFEDIATSFWRILIAYLIAALLGWTLAVSLSRKGSETVGLPFLDVLQSFPTFAVLPTAVYFWGASSATVIVFLVFAIIWPIVFSIVSSLKLLRHDWIDVVEVFHLRGFEYVKKFLIPASLPGLVTGSIVGLGDGWEALIATEIIVRTPLGLGSFFQSFSHNPTMTALGIFGFLLFIFMINKVLWLRLLDWSHRKMTE